MSLNRSPRGRVRHAAVFFNYIKGKSKYNPPLSFSGANRRIFGEIPEISRAAPLFLSKKVEKSRPHVVFQRGRLTRMADAAKRSPWAEYFRARRRSTDYRERRRAASARMRAMFSSSVTQVPSGSGRALCIPWKSVPPVTIKSYWLASARNAA